MDAAGRRSIRRAVDDQDGDIRVVTPPFLFYILYDNELISRREFCEACGELLEREGWTGYSAVKAGGEEFRLIVAIFWTTACSRDEPV